MMKKLTRRLLALTLAILMVSALVLNVSAASYYHEGMSGGYNYYCSASCTSSQARGATATESRTSYGKTRVEAHGIALDEQSEFTQADTSPERLGGSTMVMTGRVYTWCKVIHYLDGIVIYEFARLEAN